MESWKPGCLRDGAVIVGQEPEIMDGSSKGAASESSQIICHRIVAVQRQASPLQRGSEVTVASVFGHKPGCRGCLLVAGTSLVRRDAHLMLLLLTIELGGVEDERGPIYLRRGRAVTSLVVYCEPCRWVDGVVGVCLWAIRKVRPAAVGTESSPVDYHRVLNCCC